MQEVFSYEEKTNKRISDGYEMTSTISVKGIEIEKTGDVISAAVGNGSNTISGITYESSKYDETYQAALKEAVELAKKKADLMAAAGGSTIQEMISIKENYEDTSARYTGVSADAAPKSLAANSASARTQTPVSVEPGTIKIHAPAVSYLYGIDHGLGSRKIQHHIIQFSKFGIGYGEYIFVEYLAEEKARRLLQHNPPPSGQRKICLYQILSDSDKTALPLPLFFLFHR